jgi:hypothetical protein
VKLGVELTEAQADRAVPDASDLVRLAAGIVRPK